MMVVIPDALPPDPLRHCQQLLANAPWADGRATAGHLAASAKQNLQLPAEHPVALELANLVLAAISQHPRFVAAALPLKVLPPMFNCYRSANSHDGKHDNHHYGSHVDNAIRVIPGANERLRADLSCTLFLSDPGDYDGGELTIADTYGSHAVKLPAGQLIVYPGASLHHVTPVTRGTRLAAVFWVQSFVRDDAQRSILFELDTTIQRLTQQRADTAALTALTGVYHNLLRQWADT